MFGKAKSTEDSRRGSINSSASAKQKDMNVIRTMGLYLPTRKAELGNESVMLVTFAGKTSSMRVLMGVAKFHDENPASTLNVSELHRGEED